MTPETIKDFEALTGADALTPAERRLIDKCRAGEDCILDGALPTEATPENTIRASLLKLLIIGGTTDCGLNPRGVRLWGGWVVGELDLSFHVARGETTLSKCNFCERPRMLQADLQLLNLPGSSLPGLMAQGMKVTGSVFFRSVSFAGTVFLSGAEIGGQLTCDHATFDGKGNLALDAQGVKVGASLHFNSIAAIGTVAVNGANIGGQLNFVHSAFDGNGREALNAREVKVDKNLILRSVKATGIVAVSEARIGGQLDCGNADFNGKGGESLNAQGVRVGASFFLRSVKAIGKVSVNGADIGGELACAGAILDGKGNQALEAQGVKVGASLYLNSITATGTIALNGANIGGSIELQGASLDGSGREAFTAEKLRVSHVLFWRVLKKIEGSVTLDGAHVGDLADDLDSWPKGPDQLILNGFTYDRIAGGPTDADARLAWLRSGANFMGVFFPQPYEQLAKVLSAMGHLQDSRKVRMAAIYELARHYRIHLRSCRKIARGLRRLSNQQPGLTLEEFDTWRTRIAPVQRPNLDGVVLRFNQLHDPSTIASTALTSLPQLTWDFARQQFRNDMWLWAVQCRLRIAMNSTVDLVLRLVAGYGYSPWRSAVWLIVLWLSAWSLADAVWTEGSFAPNSDVVLVSEGWRDLMDMDCIGPVKQQPPVDELPCVMNPADLWSAKGQPGMDWESFSGWGYGLDLVVPILTLGQTDAWAPSKDRGIFGKTLWWGRWIFEALGWIITALGAAAITGIMQRGRD